MTVTQPSTFILADPELYLPRDAPALRAASRIMLVGSFQATVASVEELLTVRRGVEKVLADEVRPEQRAITAPAYVVREWSQPLGETTTLYGEIMSPDQAAGMERDSGGDADEQATIASRVTDAMRRGWFFGRFYSTITPEGETGCWHRSQIDHCITADEFATARAEGWPS